jgi:hypothetical protein
MSDALFMVWRDADPKLPTHAKLGEALTYYEETRKRRPNVVLMNPSDATPLKEEYEGAEMEFGVEIRERLDIQPSHFYVGHEPARDVIEVKG